MCSSPTHPPTSARLLDLQVSLHRNHAGVCQLCCANISLDLRSEPDLSLPRARTSPHLPGGLFVLSVLWYQSPFSALLYPKCSFNQNHVFPKPSLMLCKVALSCSASHNNNIGSSDSVSKCVACHCPAQPLTRTLWSGSYYCPHLQMGILRHKWIQ